MRMPTWKELRQEAEQLEVLEHPLDQSLFVVGPPGSGKTVLAVRRARMVAEEEKALHPVAVVTYNRMLRRLLDLLQDGDVDAWTMQKFIWEDYHERMKESPPRRPDNPYAYQWQPMLQRLQSDCAFPNRRHLVVDEGQDLPEDFFRYASRHVARTMTVFADEDQALSDQRTTLEQIKKAAGLSDPIILGRNHRNTPEVARLAEYFHSGRLPAAAVRRQQSGELPRLVRSADTGTTIKLVSNWYRNYSGSVGAIVDSNETGKELQRQLAHRLPRHRIDIYEHKGKNEDSINVLKDGVTVLNKESVKGQEFDTVFVLELERFIPCENDVKRRAMYMMCTRARDHLFLVHGPGALSTEAARALPGPDILERS